MSRSSRVRFRQVRGLLVCMGLLQAKNSELVHSSGAQLEKEKLTGLLSCSCFNTSQNVVLVLDAEGGNRNFRFFLALDFSMMCN